MEPRSRDATAAKLKQPTAATYGSGTLALRRPQRAYKFLVQIPGGFLAAGSLRLSTHTACGHVAHPGRTPSGSLAETPQARTHPPRLRVALSFQVK